jgi:hypothetical protein
MTPKVGDFVEAVAHIREPLGEHIVNEGTRGYIVSTTEFPVAYRHEVVWERSRKACWVSSSDIRVLESAEKDDE